MTMQFSAKVRNARLDAVETEIGTLPIVEIRTGSAPANCAAASTGNVLVQQAAPSDWLALAAAGVKAKAGTWSFTAVGTGTAGYFRIYRAGSPSECDIQGTIGVEMTIDNASIAVGQTVVVNTFQMTDGNA